LMCFSEAAFRIVLADCVFEEAVPNCRQLWAVHKMRGAA
jgi:hypothetical protein